MSLTKIVNENNSIFNVEKVKSNKAPRHFFDAERETKLMKINGKDVKVMINRDRTQYVLFQLVEPKSDNPNFIQSYYVRDHKFFDSNEVKKFVKPSQDPNAQVEQPKVDEPATSDKPKVQIIKAAK